MRSFPVYLSNQNHRCSSLGVWRVNVPCDEGLIWKLGSATSPGSSPSLCTISPTEGARDGGTGTHGHPHCVGR